MAGRFRGPHSPGSDGGGLPPSLRHRLATRPKWVTIAASPFLIAAFFQPPLGMVGSLAGFGLIATAMWLTREGLAAEAAYDLRRVARRPAVPRKLLGGLLAGLGLGLGAAEPGAIAGAAVIGLAGFALHWLAFGADPMRDKGIDGDGGFQQDRAARMIDEGEAHLARIQQAIGGLGDRRLDDRVARFAGTVRRLFERVRDNPGDLSATRRYLGIYLQGASEATDKFASLYARHGDAKSRAAYEAFLDDLEKDFSAQSGKLLDADRSDLKIEIEVLRERLAREGVRPVDGGTTPLSEDARRLDEVLSPRQGVTAGRR
ncbi:5-bromo-4-chloroindolyl phosphate hydrolysis family protein [Paracoccus spongiarum]|uniref:5-bromo-4-chloroindolyl phosphate hydrolysis family protein n=1 Tax=Paracoccus spongiarum TaxID=3064387 RepID=A0ABT9JCE6_9RHOB|nr:5-bromo-4-chloroindolyl phosphate hydrolysis family protein [Paracoccus sp. 2205BS29-5]MDP5307477.1 5-bromo-4-chloroindolyl phosphate hydrolysis family protein [Paracoccus sp. 2205BS29-5]